MRFVKVAQFIDGATQEDDRREEYNGTWYRTAVQFANGYGASIVQNPMSYGNRVGEWELAVVGEDGKIDYTTPITSDAIGYLTPREVFSTCVRISELPEVKR